ncbi:hypothetical protein MTo_02137 [Microcystis aeruginosa NIES-1211]|uniref:hypothetical protein n=1 Tax=Microcystis TaxID=1125 RepID=UPI000D95F932|nr:hypothetical protein [Microcystis aeruginosa]GBL14832.1 hypothetical protein MTo_02137 [Microcystis aeruginosa NIES-1211]
MLTSFIDTNIWLYRFFEDQRIEVLERERKRIIATSITEESNLIISTQVINEISVNLLRKANFQEERISSINRELYNREHPNYVMSINARKGEKAFVVTILV